MDSCFGVEGKKGSDWIRRHGSPENKAILVVDDEETIGLGMSEILKISGFKASYVTSGPLALEEVQKNHYSLVFMDIVMPGMDGLEAYRQIRAIAPNINVVMFTGFHKDVDNIIMKGVEEGMIDEYIRKPFFAREIVDIARKYV